jgi:biopolymer transport protein ExbB/biopolymer transport protein TolQ
MEINLVELWSSMGLPVRMVVILLSMQAVACIAVTIDRVLLLRQSTQRAHAFAGQLQPAIEAGEYDRALSLADGTQANHLTALLSMGLKTFLSQARSGDTVEHSAEMAKRALERKGDIISRELNRGMNVLASTGSTAPFVGLLGTVLGIINAFRLIAATGSGGIGTIGAAIGEALVVTGYGLVVAIPSVLVFNFLSGRIAGYEAMLVNAGGDLVDRLEMVGAQARAAAAANAAAAAAAAAAPPAAPPAAPAAPTSRPPLPRSHTPAMSR